MTITSQTVNLDQSECRKINSHLEIYTKCACQQVRHKCSAGGLVSPRPGKTLVRMFGTYKNHITEQVKLMGATTSPSIEMCFEAKLFGRLGLKFGPRRKCSHCPLDNRWPVLHVKYTGIYERLFGQFKPNFDQTSPETI